MKTTNSNSSNKIKVLECIRQGQVGGGESHLIDLVTHLDKDKFEPIVLSFTDGQMITTLKEKGIKTNVIHTESGFDFRVWRQVLDLMKKEKIDIVHAHGTRANSNIFWAADQLHIPIVYTVHGWSFHQDQKPYVRKIRETIERLLTNRSDTTISVSFSNQKDGIERFNMPRSKVIYYGIDLDRFNPKREFKKIREEWKVSEDKTLVGFLVRMTIQKDPHTMMMAIKKVLDKTKDIYFVMIGEGDLKESTLNIVKELNISSNIIFNDFRQDVPDVLNAIDIYCLPSLWEGMPIGLIESMAMKRAIISSPVDGTKEAIINNERGLLVPEQNPDALAEAILKLHYDIELRNALAENAYNYAKEKFNAQRMARDVEKIYKKVLSKKKINYYVKLKIRIKKLIPFSFAKKLRGFWQKILGFYYKGSKYYCPYCQHSSRKLLPAGLKMTIYDELEVAGSGYRKNCTCPRCFSIDRDRLIYIFMKNKTDIFSNKLKILHIAPEPSIKSMLRSLPNIDYHAGINYRDSFYFSKDIIQLDLTNIYYKNNEFDVVICNHVLQFIQDDKKAISEIYRILKPGGMAILQVPISLKLDETLEDEYFIMPEDHEKHFFQFEKVRIYARDYKNRLENAGFTVKIYNPTKEKWIEDIDKYAINPKEDVYVGYKE